MAEESLEEKQIAPGSSSIPDLAVITVIIASKRVIIVSGQRLRRQ